MLISNILYAIAILILIVIAGRIKFSKNPSTDNLLLIIGMLVIPSIAWISGLTTELDQAKSTEFCLSCHEMTPYGKSLFVDDNEYIPAHHFQNNLIDQKQACFTCHTNYTMFGGVTAKLKGFKHVYIHYTQDTKQEDIKLYDPFSNRECLHCHGLSLGFIKNKAHNEEEGLFASIIDNKKSCLTSGCHDTAHDIASFPDLEFKTEWRNIK